MTNHNDQVIQTLHNLNQSYQQTLQYTSELLELYRNQQLPLLEEHLNGITEKDNL